jgi:hypothetical protein
MIEYLHPTRIETMLVFAAVKSDDGWPAERELIARKEHLSP